MNIFYTPGISGNHYQLDETESKHCIRVMRHQKGDELIMVDGAGGFYKVVITDPNPKRCVVEVTEAISNFEKRNHNLHLAVAPTKNIERFEWFLEKATEIGVDEITPLLCEHSERKQVKTERLEKVMIAAMKQSLKAYLPKLNNLTNFDSFIKSRIEASKFIAHCNNGEKINLFNAMNPGESVVVLIGPEGDFSKQEIEMALNNGFQPISLGNSRLRTETAGVVSVQIVNLVNEQ